MTPDDHRMIEDLFQRLSAQGPVSKDPQADRVIADLFRANPNAGYLLVQTALVYEHQLSEQEGRIQELEAQVAQGQQAPPAYGSGSFLGGRIGQGRGSVPQAGAPSPWSQPQAQAPRAAGYAPAPQGMQPAPAAPGFFRSALQTAAGVAGGMVFANSLSSLFGGHEAHAGGFGTSDQSAALRDADATQDELQDEVDSQDAADDAAGDASYDDGGIDT